MSDDKKALQVKPEQTQALQISNPEQEVAFAQKCANALMTVIESKPKKVMINGKQYLEFEDWQTIARFYGVTVKVEYSKPLVSNGKFAGYEARAVVVDKEGRELSAAEASCTVRESKWANRERFQLRSMAQTRSCAKALRNVFSWVVALKGLATTPAEEMDDYTGSYVDQGSYAAPEVVDDPPAATKPAQPAPAAPTQSDDKLSDKQLNLIKQNLERKNIPHIDLLNAIDTQKGKVEDLSKSEASKAIDWLFSQK